MALTDDPDRQTSLTLLQRLRANESGAWERLVRLYRPLVLYWCGRWSVKGADADDLAQEVFQTAAAKLPEFRRDRPGDTFRGWLRGITRNKLLAHGRKARDEPPGIGGSTAQFRLHQLADTVPEEDGGDPASEVSALLRRAVDQVRGEFEAPTWRAFLLTAVDGKPAPEAAAELGLSAAAVRQAKSRVLRRLKLELGELIE